MGGHDGEKYLVLDWSGKRDIADGGDSGVHVELMSVGFFTLTLQNYPYVKKAKEREKLQSFSAFSSTLQH